MIDRDWRYIDLHFFCSREQIEAFDTIGLCNFRSSCTYTYILNINTMFELIRIAPFCILWRCWKTANSSNMHAAPHHWAACELTQTLNWCIAGRLHCLFQSFAVSQLRRWLLAMAQLIESIHSRTSTWLFVCGIYSNRAWAIARNRSITDSIIDSIFKSNMKIKS